MSQRDYTGTAGVLGGDWIPGDPDAVAALAQRLLAIRDEVDRAKQDLLGANDDSGWEGDAADAFRGTLHTLPDELEKVRASYDAAGNALRTYETPFRQLQRQSVQAARSISDARDRLARVDGAKSSGQAAANPDYWNNEESQAQAELDRATNAAHAVRQEFDGAVSTCLKGIRDAGDLGIKNDLGSFWQRYAVDDVGATAFSLGSGIVHAFVDLPGELIQFVEHPSWDQFWKIIRDVSIVLTVLALVIPGIGEVAILARLALGVNALVTVHDAYDLSQGKGSWLTVGTDLLAFTAVGAAKSVGKQAEIAAGDVRMNTALTNLAEKRIALAKADKTASQSELKNLSRIASHSQSGLGKQINFAQIHIRQAREAVDSARAEKATLRIQLGPALERQATLATAAHHAEQAKHVAEGAAAVPEVVKKAQDVQTQQAQAEGHRISAKLPHAP